MPLIGADENFEKSFKASENGWSRPTGPTLLGPFRSWISPRILRSKSVKKATLKRIKIMCKIKLIKS